MSREFQHVGHQSLNHVVYLKYNASQGTLVQMRIKTRSIEYFKNHGTSLGDSVSCTRSIRWLESHSTTPSRVFSLVSLYTFVESHPSKLQIFPSGCQVLFPSVYSLYAQNYSKDLGLNPNELSYFVSSYIHNSANNCRK